MSRAKHHFDPYLHTEEYRKIHSDEGHLNDLIRFMEMRPEGRCLDLGTGNGYVAFALARRYPRLFVDGLDIAETSISRNAEIARSEGLSRAVFRVYDGGVFPYPDGVFDGIVCRYSFHHYPHPEESIREIRRVIIPGGFFLFSDPFAEDEDASDFINSYQGLKPDGHVRFYRRNQIDELFLAGGFRLSGDFESSVRYPRPFDARYQALMDTTDPSILDLYGVQLRGEEIFLTARVMNKKFLKP